MKRFWCIGVIINLLTTPSQAMIADESLDDFVFSVTETQALATNPSTMVDPFFFEDPGVNENSRRDIRDPNSFQDIDFDSLSPWDPQAIAGNEARDGLQEFSMADQSIAEKIQRVAHEDRVFEIAQKSLYTFPRFTQRGPFIPATEMSATQGSEAYFASSLDYSAPTTRGLLQESFLHDAFPLLPSRPMLPQRISQPSLKLSPSTSLKKKKKAPVIALPSNVEKRRAPFPRNIMTEDLAQDFKKFESYIEALTANNIQRGLQAYSLLQYLSVEDLKIAPEDRQTIAQHVIEEGHLTLLGVNFSEYTNFKFTQEALWSRINFCTWLTSLVVQGCGLSVFPVSSLRQLKELTHLDLSKNQLATFPTIEQSSKLESVILSGNALISLPSIDKDKSLLFLDISNNNFPNYLKFLYMPSIAALNISHNPEIGTFKAEYFQNLSRLDIRHNDISKPFDFSSFYSLQKLWCTGNPFIDGPGNNTLQQLGLFLAEDGSLNEEQIQQLQDYYAPQEIQKYQPRKDKFL